MHYPTPSTPSMMMALTISLGTLYYPFYTVLFVMGYILHTSFSVWYPFFRQVYGAYLSYKEMVDPDHRQGHLSVLFHLARTLVQIGWARVRVSSLSSTSTPTRFNARYLRIPFQYREKTYYYLLKVPRGVVPIQSVLNQDEIDVREEIEPYLGPNLDCFGAVLTPADFGHRRLVFRTAMDRVITVEENETIQLTV